MAKIKTSPDNKNKVTISDLNSNIIKLTNVMQESATLNKTYIKDIQKAKAASSSKSSSSSKKDNDPSWYAAAGQEMWKATAPERKSIGSTIVGGLTGINPAIVQKLGIDKAIGSVFKSIGKDLKQKWAAAGLGASNSKKVNSAIEANKISPVTSRLDKIIKLMGLSKKSEIQQKPEKKSFLGKLLSFLGSVLGPLLKLGAIVALLAGIAQLVRGIADYLGVKFTDAGKAAGRTTNLAGKGLGKAGGILSELFGNEAKYTKALKDLQENSEFKKLKPTERAKLFGKNSRDVKVSKELRELVEQVNAAEHTLDTGPGSKAFKENAKLRASEYVNKVAPLSKDAKPGFLTRTWEWAKNKANIKNNPAVGKALETGGKFIEKGGKLVYIGATGMEVVGDVARGDIREGARDTAGAAGGWWGFGKGMKYGWKAGSYVPFLGQNKWTKYPTKAATAIAGALLGGETMEAGSRIVADKVMDYSLGKEENSSAYKNASKIERFMRDVAGVYGALMEADIKEANMTEQEKEIKKLENRATLDIQYKALRTKDPKKIKEIYEKYGLTPDEFINVYSKAIDYGGTTKRRSEEELRNEAIWKLNQIGILPGPENWKIPMNTPGTYLNTVNPMQTTSASTPIYGLTTDFNTPITPADNSEGVSSIANNTRTLTDYVKNISDGMDILRSGALQSNMSKFSQTNLTANGQNPGPTPTQEPPSMCLFTPGGLNNVR